MPAPKPMFSDNAKSIVTFLRENPTVDLTANEIAEALGISPRAANGVITGLSRRNPAVAVREEVERDGNTVKYVRLTDEGRACDLEAMHE